MTTDLSAYTHRSRLQKRWRDHDEYAHVNNSVYMTYLEEARIRYFHEAYQWDWKTDGLILARVELDFVRPVTYTDPAWVYTRVMKLGDKSFQMEYRIVNELPDKKVIMTRATSTMVMFDYKSNQPYPVPYRIREKMLAFEKEGTIQT